MLYFARQAALLRLLIIFIGLSFFGISVHAQYPDYIAEVDQAAELLKKADQVNQKLIVISKRLDTLSEQTRDGTTATTSEINKINTNLQVVRDLLSDYFEVARSIENFSRIIFFTLLIVTSALAWLIMTNQKQSSHRACRALRGKMSPNASNLPESAGISGGPESAGLNTFSPEGVRATPYPNKSPYLAQHDGAQRPIINKNSPEKYDNNQYDDVKELPAKLDLGAVMSEFKQDIDRQQSIPISPARPADVPR